MRSSQNTPQANFRRCGVAPFGHHSRSARHGNTGREFFHLGVHVSLRPHPYMVTGMGTVATYPRASALTNTGRRRFERQGRTVRNVRSRVTLNVIKKSENTLKVHPAANLTPELAVSIEEHKDEIIRILGKTKSSAAPESSSPNTRSSKWPGSSSACTGRKEL